MKKTAILYLALLVFAFSGCAALKQAKVDASACFSDPACRAEAIAKAEEWKHKVSDTVGVVVPFPWAAPVSGAVTGAVALVAFLIAGGKKKRDDVKPG